MSDPVLPDGWRLQRRIPAVRCAACGHETPEGRAWLRAPDGREWPLIGNHNRTQENEMIRAIVLHYVGDTSTSPATPTKPF